MIPLLKSLGMIAVLGLLVVLCLFLVAITDDILKSIDKDNKHTNQ